MTAGQIAAAIRKNPEQAVEFMGQISAYEMAVVASKLGISPHEVYVSCGSAEYVRVSVPVSIPIRKTPMGERV